MLIRKTLKWLKTQIPIFVHALILTLILLMPFLAMAASVVGKDNLAVALVTITGISGLMYIFSL
jgi:hypothetical protein